MSEATAVRFFSPAAAMLRICGTLDYNEVYISNPCDEGF